MLHFALEEKVPPDDKRVLSESSQGKMTSWRPGPRSGKCLPVSCSFFGTGLLLSKWMLPFFKMFCFLSLYPKKPNELSFFTRGFTEELSCILAERKKLRSNHEGKRERVRSPSHSCFCPLGFIYREVLLVTVSWLEWRAFGLTVLLCVNVSRRNMCSALNISPSSSFHFFLFIFLPRFCPIRLSSVCFSVYLHFW